MEFKIINPTDDSGFLQTIEFNFDELKSELIKGLEKYQNLTFTDETEKEAKETRAGLNKFREAIETRRKEIKKLCLKPYEEFEAKVKELTKLIDEPILAIDVQIKSFEEQKAETKLNEIKEFYNGVVGDLEKLVTFEKIYNPKWLNVTYKMNNIQKEIKEVLSKIRCDLNVLEGLKLDNQLALQVQDKYLQTLDFSTAMAEKTRLEELQKALKGLEKPKEDVEHLKQEQPALNDQPATSAQEKIYYREFFVRGTKEQLIQLSAFMQNNNIEYGGINK